MFSKREIEKKKSRILSIHIIHFILKLKDLFTAIKLVYTLISY